MSNPMVILPYDMGGIEREESSSQWPPQPTWPPPPPPQGPPPPPQGPPPPPPPGGAPRKKSKRIPAGIRQANLIKLALYLANVKAFDHEFHIKQENGSFNLDSNLVKLLNFTQTRVRSQYGIDDLVRHMAAANVDPNLIINEMVRQRLIELKNMRRPHSRPPPPPSISTDNGSPRKRRLVIDEDVNQEIKSEEDHQMETLQDLERRANESLWQIPFSEEDDPEL